MKPMTFEEWWGDKRPDIKSSECAYAEAAWDKARLGMIPEDGAIQIPPEKEWPEKNENGTSIYGVALVFTIFEDEIDFKERWGKCAIRYIPRSKPVWVPRVGEAVFFANLPVGKAVTVGKIIGIDEKWFKIKESDGAVGEWDIDHIKPFHESYIGKPWSEIPEGKRS